MRQILSSVASIVVGACCLGLTPLVAALSALGAGFLINDAILIPLLVLFLALSVWSLNRSRERHRRKGPLLLGLFASVLAFASLWWFVPLLCRLHRPADRLGLGHGPRAPICTGLRDLSPGSFGAFLSAPSGTRVALSGRYPSACFSLSRTATLST